ncbi:MAG: hypothetical protein M5U15_00280 [Kiritimatiellae bacterium]|nr:hypothetical protein [Kiritimatiellia bacterium]
MRVTPLIASEFLTDGGTMFGLVPKPIWSKRIPADEKNRIRQHAHTLLVELDEGRKGLIDAGCGSSTRFSEKRKSVTRTRSRLAVVGRTAGTEHHARRD